MNWRLRFFLWALHRKPEPLPVRDIQKYREHADRSWRIHKTWIDGRQVKVKDVKDFTLPNRHGENIRIRHYKSLGSDNVTMFYFHGGGWVGRNIDTYDNVCRRIRKNAGIDIYSIEYRKAPEVPFPGAIEDGIDMIRQIARTSAKDNFILCGDSAGGNMAISISYLLKDEIPFQKLLLFYPPLTTDFTFPSFSMYGKQHIIETETITWMRDQYLPSPELYNNVLASPLLHPSFDFLPPTMVTVGGKDPLQDHLKLFKEKIIREGKSIHYIEYTELPHGFFLLYNLSPLVRQAYEDVYRFIAEPIFS